MADLVAVADIADALGVSVQRAHQLTREQGFPQTAQVVTRGKQTMRWWNRADVRKWAREQGRTWI